MHFHPAPRFLSLARILTTPGYGYCRRGNNETDNATAPALPVFPKAARSLARAVAASFRTNLSRSSAVRVRAMRKLAVLAERTDELSKEALLLERGVTFFARNYRSTFFSVRRPCLPSSATSPASSSSTPARTSSPTSRCTTWPGWCMGGSTETMRPRRTFRQLSLRLQTY